MPSVSCYILILFNLLSPSAVQSMLLTHYQVNKEYEHMSRLPPVQHIKHVHLQSQLWDIQK